MEPVSIVTIKEVLPLYKGEEKANNVELIHLKVYVLQQKLI